MFRLPVLQLLDTLKENDCKATWFLIGKHIDMCPEIVERIHAEGVWTGPLHYIPHRPEYQRKTLLSAVFASSISASS